MDDTESLKEIQALFPQLNLQNLLTLFVRLLDERYPAAEKVLLYVAKLLEKHQLDPIPYVQAQITIVGAFRRMIKQVSPRFYRSLQHRDELFVAIVEAGEMLEDELEELEEELEEGLEEEQQ